MSTALRTYSRGDELITLDEEVPHASRVYHFDHQGTTQCLTDGAGAVTDRFATDAWGMEIRRSGDSLNRRWYIGNSSLQTDTRGLLTDNVGPYSSTLGGFLSRAVGYRSPTPFSGQVYAHMPASPIVAPTSTEFFLRTTRNTLESKECGGASWALDWAVRDRNNRPPDRPPVCGFVIQKVTVRSGGIHGCRPLTDLSPSATCLPDALIYYEAWAYRYEAGPVVRLFLNDDTFRFPGLSSPKCNGGNWTICGDAVFMSVPCPGPLVKERDFPPPGNGWTYGLAACATKFGPCGNWMTTAWCSSVAPPGFLKPTWRVQRALRMEWECDECTKCCDCVKCGGVIKEGNRPRGYYACPPCPQDTNVALCTDAAAASP